MTPFGVNAGILGAVDLAFPYTAALSKTDGKVLSVLAGTTRPLGGREVARLAGVSQNGAWGALRRLVSQGVVIEQPAGGRSLLYTLNRDHIAAEPIIAMTRLRSILIERLKEHLAGWEVQPIHASIFGSAARGDGDTESDIDILVIRPRDVEEDDDRWRSQITRSRVPSTPGPGTTRVSRRSPCAISRACAANVQPSSRASTPMGSLS